MVKKKTEMRRQSILEVAAEVFREFGYERTLMSEICARLGGSKATLYNYFPSKEELFYAIMFQSTEADFESVHQAFDPSTEDIFESLLHFGEKFLAFLFSPLVRAHRRLAFSESGRSELGRIMYERGVLRSYNVIAEFLRQAMSIGKLRKADPFVAAQHLCALLQSELQERFLLQVLEDVGADEIKGSTARAIEVFMAAYGCCANSRTDS